MSKLVPYLTDIHALEVQALAQMRAAPGIAGDRELAGAFEKHRLETERHEALIRARLADHGESPSRIEDLLGAVSGKGFVLFARVQPDTPGKLAAHAFSYEHLELAAYEVLAHVAREAGDDATVDVAQRIRAEEDAMAGRIGALWDRAVDASIGAGDDLAEDLDHYLADAHALEAQAISLFERPAEALADLFAKRLEESRAHQRALEERLAVREIKPSRLKDAVLALGGLNWSAFFRAQPDTDLKLAVFAYAFVHLEIAGYEQLARVARRVGDDGTVTTAQEILAQERAAAEELYSVLSRG